jgi:hypothetical protein
LWSAKKLPSKPYGDCADCDYMFELSVL